MSELIQNAMDAVERRLDQSEAGTYEPKIYIFIDLQENSFEVVDNGVGFRQAEFRAFMAPNISFKGGQKTRGNKGVGATYIAYGFNHLELRTKSPEFSFNGILKDGRKWVDDVQGALTRPKVHEIGEISEIFESVDRGTSFKIRFGGPGTRPASLKWYGATSPGQWLYLLLLKTPLGHISLPGLGPAKIKFDVIVRSADGVCSRLDDQPAMYKWPHHEIHASRRIADIVKMQIEAAQKGKDPSTAVDKFRGSNGVYEIFNADDLDAMRNLSPEEKLLLKSVNLSAYGYFVYSTSVWDQLNDVKAKLRKSYRVLKGRLHLANNGMVQGDAITIPLTKSTGHQNQAHVVVHFEGADPDLGRKGFQPELRDLAEKVSVYVVGRLAARRDLLKSDSGAKPEIEKLKAVHEWIRDQEAHERENPLVLLNENFFLPTRRISIKSIPVSEQDVIVLFNQLVAGGVIRGLRLLATSQVAQYDGVFRFVAEEPLNNLSYDKLSNPLGIHEEQLANTYEGPPLILEYKFSLDGLIREFEGDVKAEKNVSLAIFWEMGSDYAANYSITSLLDQENIHLREHHGVTHIVRSRTSSFYAICLKELISFLNNMEDEQENQRAKYGDDI